MNGFAKRKISLRYWLLGKGYNQALTAMDYAADLHCGIRKDGVTPEFDHQVSIAHYARTLLPCLQYQEETITTIFLHDTREDYGVAHEEIVSRWGGTVAHSVNCLTKKYRGNVVQPEELFAAMAKDPIASFAKAADRVHNLQSMVGVFTFEKQRRYIEEVRTYFLPMLKLARRNFPHQELAYENVKHMLLSQIELLEANLNAHEAKAA